MPPPAPFRAFRIHEDSGQITSRFESITVNDLGAGDVLIKVHYSSINYKDALAATGAGKILRKYPLVGGIDLAGEVISTDDARYRVGDKVLVTGCELSETHDGGYAEYARVKGDWVVPVPGTLDEFRAMGLGTAGFTAGLAIHRMEQNGQNPANGPVVVTGATGGVGCVAINMLSARGYDVVAVSGKPEATSFLRSLGAKQVLLRQEIVIGSRPLEAARWAGAIDNVGGEILSWLTRTVGPRGNVASVGLVGGVEFRATVMPFILRGVNLLGINSSATPRELRLEVWKRIGSDLLPPDLQHIVTRTVSFEELPEAFEDYLKGKVVGRTVVAIG
jgi:acrylyl-CoA reductase (NADPH)